LVSDIPAGDANTNELFLQCGKYIDAWIKPAVEKSPDKVHLINRLRSSIMRDGKTSPNKQRRSKAGGSQTYSFYSTISNS